MPDKGARGPETARRPEGARGFPSLRAAGALAAAIVALDQGAKALVREHVPLYTSVPVIDGFLDLTHVRNTGAAFGFLNTLDIPFKAALMTAVALAALAAIGVYAAQLSPRETLSRLGLAFVFGGGGRQPDRSDHRGLRDRFRRPSTGAAGTSGRSTSPTPRSRSAPPA